MPSVLPLPSSIFSSTPHGLNTSYADNQKTFRLGSYYPKAFGFQGQQKY